MPVVFHERVEQHVFGAQVEVVGRFVEQQKICGMQQQAQQRVAAALAAGEHADLLENVVFGKKKTAEQAAQFGFAGAGRGVAEIVEDARVGIEFLVLILREVVGFHVVAEAEFAVRDVAPCPPAV